MEVLYFGTLTLIFILILKHFRPRTKTPSSTHIRGRFLISFKQAQRLALKLSKKSSSTIFFGGIHLPEKAAESHFLITGATGAGKTLTIRLLMQSVLPQINSSNTRAIIYDAKSDILPILTTMCPNILIQTLHPFDDRGVAWDISADIKDKASAMQLASALIPHDHSYNQYFTETARHILTGVILSLIKNCVNWALIDIIKITRLPDTIKQALLSNSETSYLVDLHFNNEKTISDVISTLGSKLQNYESIASAWAEASVKISLETFITSQSILILGESPKHHEALNSINQLIFTRLSELLLSQQENTSSKTFIFLDELRSLGKLSTLSALLTKGRSKGVSLILGFQDIDGLRALYGPYETNELVAQCGNVAILALNSSETATWASEVFGSQELLEENSSHTIGKGTSTSKSTTLTTRPIILPSEFLAIPSVSKQSGLTGFYSISTIGAYRASLSLIWILKNLIRPDKNILSFKERNIKDLMLEPNFSKQDHEAAAKQINFKQQLEQISKH